MRTIPTHRQVFILAPSQALFQTVSVLVMTVGGLAGRAIADRPERATAPIAAMFLGTAAGTLPASQLMAMAGRRAGFMLGAVLGVAGVLCAALGVWLASMALLHIGTVLVGAYQSFARFYRFYASEAADEAFRPRAISLVLGGEIVAAFLNPFLGRIGGPLMEPTCAGSFLLCPASRWWMWRCCRNCTCRFRQSIMLIPRRGGPGCRS